MLWERSAGKIQAMVDPALAILQKQLASGDEKVALRAAAVLLRFATPSRLAGLGNAGMPPDAGKQLCDDLIAYVEAPLPGEPGAPEDMVDELDEEDEEED